MSKSLKLNNGDLVIGRARSFENVEGIDKLKQDLSLWILEQIGTDPLTPTYGSTLDGGIIDGQPIPSFIGQTLTSEAFERIEIDVQDLVARYQASQLDKIKREVLQYSGQHTLSPDETIKLIRAVRAVSVGDVVVVRVDLTTVSGAKHPSNSTPTVMAQTASEISNIMRAQLKVLDPDLSLEPLSPERKILDTVAETIADAQIDQFVVNYQFDIDTKFGQDLDRFVALFGFARQGGTRSRGTVTFGRNTAATADVFVPAGTQVIRPASSVTPLLTFFTTVDATLYANTFTVEVPVESADFGIGTNVAAGEITQIGQGDSNDISYVINENSVTGGTNLESDAELRLRFKNTIFRNVSGTRDQILALSISSKYATRANVIGPISRFIEYLQVNSDGVMTSLVPYSKYTYNFDYYVTQDDSEAEIFLTPRGVDYEFNPDDLTGNDPNLSPPIIRIVDDGLLVEGDVILLEHAYVSTNSRNEPTVNKMNAVDVFVSGQRSQEAQDALFFPGPSAVLTNTPGDTYYVGNWARADTATRPDVGNRFQELIWQPVMSLSGTIIIGNNEFVEGIHYWLLKDVSLGKGSRQARDGIEWAATTFSVPLGQDAPAAEGDVYVLTYDFNKLPLVINELLESHKQITTDVLVHEATSRFFNVNLIIMYTPTFAPDVVDTAITTALLAYFNSLTFGTVMQISDILDVVHDVPGVDNVRLALPGDGISYGIQEVASDGTTLLGPPYITDFFIQDSDVAVLNRLYTTRKSQNTWS
jgi:uncharacterized phage protein gp47/JayE